jgi:hypothetical protein
MIMAPLHTLLEGYKRDSAQKLQWDEATNFAFLSIQEAISELPTLHFIDPNAPIFLHTDASDYGIGAYLFQLKDGKEFPVAFFSKPFTKSSNGGTLLKRNVMQFSIHYKN